MRLAASAAADFLPGPSAQDGLHLSLSRPGRPWPMQRGRAHHPRGGAMSSEQAVALAHLLTGGIDACPSPDLEEPRRVLIALTGAPEFRFEGAAPALPAID